MSSAASQIHSSNRTGATWVVGRWFQKPPDASLQLLTWPNLTVCVWLTSAAGCQVCKIRILAPTSISELAGRCTFAVKAAVPATGMCLPPRCSLSLFKCLWKYPITMPFTHHNHRGAFLREGEGWTGVEIPGLWWELHIWVSAACEW